MQLSEALLESNDCQPFEHNEFLSEIPSKKKFTEAQDSVNQLFNVNIRDSVLRDINTRNLPEISQHLPSEEYKQFVQDRLIKTKEELLDIECNTRGQSTNNLWFQERQLRLTASNFGIVLKRRENVFPKSILAKQFTYTSNKTKKTQPCLWGQTNEQNAIVKYLETCGDNGHSIKACVECGLVINAEVPWLGGSPDCLLHDPSEDKPFGIGEVKCPFSKKDITIEDACQDPI